MTHWLENSNDGLWIYGIPGAGKTTLSTLVVDEVLTRKQSNLVGTAYFYIRHDDKDSHKPSNVLGSLICQLARHKPEALADLMKLYAQYRSHGLATPDQQDLSEKLEEISQHFTEIYIMIDGLDECGSPYDADRKRLIKAVAGLHTIKGRSIRTLVFSRAERDIEDELARMQFHTVSIAATSADLRMFVNAWLGELDVQSERLKTKIVDTLVNQANGMFMWVRAQVDYLQRLPNDTEKRNALTRLPPDLPQTYIRIFETMDSIYPKQTTTYIKRILRWLKWFDHEVEIDTLREAICIDEEGHWPTFESIPTKDKIFRWLGCLLRVDPDDNRPRLSHFTIKEFLRMDADTISSHVAQQYLVGPEDKPHVLNLCLKYAIHSPNSSTVITSLDATKKLVAERPFFQYTVEALRDLIRLHIDSDSGLASNAESHRLIERFLCMPHCWGFEVWETCYTWLDEEDISYETLVHKLPTPLHFSCFTGLRDQVEMLLSQGVDPGVTGELKGSGILPLHLAIAARDLDLFRTVSQTGLLAFSSAHTDTDETDYAEAQPDFQITRMLIHSGADLNSQVRLELCDENSTEKCCGEHVVTPLVLSLLLGKCSIAGLLLDAGADWDATARTLPGGTFDLCSVGRLLEAWPKLGTIVYRAAKLARNGGLMSTLEEQGLSQDNDAPDSQSTDSLEDSVAAELGRNGGLMSMWEKWGLLKDEDGLDSQSTDSLEDSVADSSKDDGDPQKEFVSAFQTRNWEEVRELLTKYPDLDVDCVDEYGVSAAHLASVSEGDALPFLLERGANPDLVSQVKSGCTPLCGASERGFLGNMRLLLRLGANVEHQCTGGWTPLLLAVRQQHYDAVQFLLDFEADINAKSDDGTGALHIAIENNDTNVCDSLLTRGINSSSADNYGTIPLHLACNEGLGDLVHRLLMISTELQDSLNAESLNFGTPLYIAAEGGYDPIIRQLLDHGALIDKVGTWNWLGSALMAACAEGYSDVVRTLLSRGANLEVEGSRFKSAEGTARAFRKYEILKILEEYGKKTSQESGKGWSDEGNVDADDCEKPCIGRTEENSDRGTDARQQVELPTIASAQPANAELVMR
ncbi:MAG: hypothetical protein Q9184_005754 [Pyrenodesmia sp. 2 TL-2023]